MKAMDYALKKDSPINGLYPTYINANSGSWYGGKSYLLQINSKASYQAHILWVLWRIAFMNIC